MTAKDSIDLSVVIVTYKSKDHILQCIQSVVVATKGLSSEIIIVDNNSGDGLYDLLLGKFSNVKVIENRENIGFARAANQGARIAIGRYLNILNPDTFLYPETLKIMLDFIEKDPECYLVGARTIDKDGKVIPSCRSLPHVLNITKYPLLLFLRGRKLIRPKRYFLDIWEQNKTIDVTKYNGYLTGACIITRLDYFKKMGMFDERYFLYCEDIDYGFRLKQAGYKAFFVSEATMIHLGGHSASQNPMSKLYFINAYIHYIQKNITFLHRMVYKAFLFLFALSWVTIKFLKKDCKDSSIFIQVLKCFVPFRYGKPPKLQSGADATR